MSKRLKFPKRSPVAPDGAVAFKPASDGVHAIWREHDVATQSAMAHINASRQSMVKLMAAVDGILLTDGWVWNADFLRWEQHPSE